MNKVEQIRKEIERQIAIIKDACGGYIASKSNATEYKTLLTILDYIDSLQDKCDGCNNVKGCIICENGSEWAHYQLTSVESKEIEL